MVAVTLQGRAFAEVVHDMVDGVVAANRLEDEAARPGARARCSHDAVPAPNDSRRLPRSLTPPGPGGGTADAGGLNPPAPQGREGSNPSPGTQTHSLQGETVEGDRPVGEGVLDAAVDGAVERDADVPDVPQRSTATGW